MRNLPLLFDRYIVVDWSAANQPRTGGDSIWICSLGGGGHCRVANPGTRGLAQATLGKLLAAAVRRGERVLAGFDFSFGYPHGFAAALGLPGKPWRATWDLIRTEICDDPVTNVSNRFEVADRLNRRLAAAAAFWGRPQHRYLAALPPRRTVRYMAGAAPAAVAATGTGAAPAAVGAPACLALAEWRTVEQLLRGQGRRPHSTWQLAGTGSVGSQALTGIPVVAALRADPALAAHSSVWPFEAGAPVLAPGEPAIVYAEVWPSLWDFSRARGSCRDEKQVRHLARELRARDRTGELAGMMNHPPLTCRHEEGWILGVQASGDGHGHRQQAARPAAAGQDQGVTGRS